MARSAISDYLSKLGRKGGKARAEKLSKEQRAESARKAAQTRWDREKAKQSTPKS
jgi:hypothetical protein